LGLSRNGPLDEIPFWLLKEHPELVTPVIFYVWCLSLGTHSWPESWKKANISPLPKKELPLSLHLQMVKLSFLWFLGIFKDYKPDVPSHNSFESQL